MACQWIRETGLDRRAPGRRLVVGGVLLVLCLPQGPRTLLTDMACLSICGTRKASACAPAYGIGSLCLLHTWVPAAQPWSLRGSEKTAMGHGAMAPSPWATEGLRRGVGDRGCSEYGEGPLGVCHRVLISWEAGLVACGERYGVCGTWGQSPTPT